MSLEDEAAEEPFGGSAVTQKVTAQTCEAPAGAGDAASSTTGDGLGGGAAPHVPSAVVSTHRAASDSA